MHGPFNSSFLSINLQPKNVKSGKQCRISQITRQLDLGLFNSILKTMCFLKLL